MGLYFDSKSGPALSKSSRSCRKIKVNPEQMMGSRAEAPPGAGCQDERRKENSTSGFDETLEWSRLAFLEFAFVFFSCVVVMLP
jgi:hypothetical protein